MILEEVPIRILPSPQRGGVTPLHMPAIVRTSGAIPDAGALHFIMDLQVIRSQKVGECLGLLCWGKYGSGVFETVLQFGSVAIVP